MSTQDLIIASIVLLFGCVIVLFYKLNKEKAERIAEDKAATTLFQINAK